MSNKTCNGKSDFFNEEDIWYNFYLSFNDDNLSHACNAFFNNNYSSNEEIHKANLLWIYQIISNGVDLDYIEETIPAAKHLIEEYKMSR